MRSLCIFVNVTLNDAELDRTKQVVVHQEFGTDEIGAIADLQ
jgi:hypothetical protein